LSKVRRQKAVVLLLSRVVYCGASVQKIVHAKASGW
jgi:hypothetical protein